MSVKEDIVCRLCLKIPHTGFVLIDKATRQGLDILSVKLNFHVSNDPLICEDCMEVSKRSLSFILACLNSEKQILLSDMGEDDSNIDLKDLYAIESKPIVNEDFYTCRFCLNKIEERNFVRLDGLMKENMPLNMLKQYIFQMDENITKSLICFYCRDNMENYIKFLRTCYGTEDKINMYRQREGIQSGAKVKLSFVLRFLKSTLEYTDNSIQVYGVKKEEPSIDEIAEIESIDIYDSILSVKEEFATENKELDNLLYQNDDATDHIPCTCDTKDSSCLGCHARPNKAPPFTDNMKIETISSETFEALDTEYDESDNNEIKDKITLLTRHEGLTTDPTIYKCKLCPYQGVGIKSHMLTHRDIQQAKHKNSLKSNSLTRETETEVMIFKCTTCDYRTARKCNLKAHSLAHKPEAEVTMYKCTTCDYETMHKGSLKSHSLTHKTKTEVTKYTCMTCDFKTKHKNSIKKHSLTHKTMAEVTMYECTVCDFKTKHKYNLKTHSLTHKSETEVTMYKCTACNYKTLRKCNLNAHSMTHKTEAEVTMYKCMICDFVTKYMRSLKNHLLTHKGKEDLTMYRCVTCNYRTTYKKFFKTHLLTHKTEAQVTMYECTVCDFKTKYKKCFKTHSLTHKTKAQVTMYECTVCDFKTNYRHSLKNHLLILHKTEAQVMMYKCTICDFETNQRDSLNSHLLNHKKNAEITLYKCMACDFETTYEDSLKRHSMTHKTQVRFSILKQNSRVASKLVH